MAVNRVTHGVTFNTGISTAEFIEQPAGQATGQTQGMVLPGSTKVTEALDSVFPQEATLDSQLMSQLAAAGNSTLLRTASGFRRTAQKTIRSLKGKQTPASQAAARELEELMDDAELLEQYRAALLES